MPEARNLSQLSFIDYFRIKQMLDKDEQLPTIEVSQHNDDVVTYKDAYDILQDIIGSLSSFSRESYEFDYTLTSMTLAYLENKGVLTKEDISDIIKSTEKIYKKGKEND